MRLRIGLPPSPTRLGYTLRLLSPSQLFILSIITSIFFLVKFFAFFMMCNYKNAKNFSCDTKNNRVWKHFFEKVC